jgi:TolB-like protein/Flp pilus assembly protein TadD
MPSRKACNPELVHTHLEKILSSTGFARNDRLSGFLRFVVEQELFGRGDELKESVIGVEYFGRQTDYDVRHDSVVRNEAGKLRSRLAEYYVGEGAGDGLVIDLPKGGYKPVFRQMEPAPAVALPPAGSPRRVWKLLAVALAGFGFALAALWWQGILHRNAPISIAVLPLINLDRNPDHDYFADGLTGEIIRNLSIIEGLGVRSQTSSFAFKGKPQNVHDVGKLLDAEYVLEGSVLLSGQQLRISAQLVRVRDDYPLWSGKFDRELTDVFAIQDEISRGIVNGLRLKLGRGRRRYETSGEAYDLYLRARALQLRRGPSGYDPSIVLFKESIAKDVSFAPAYAGLAAAHTARSNSFRFLDVVEELTKMRAAAEKAIQLDPLLAEAHDALGMAYTRDGQWGQSEESFRRAIELDAGRSESHLHFAAFLLLPLGRYDEALRHLRIAEKADPLSSGVRFYLAYVLNAARRYGEAAVQCEKLPTDFEDKSLLLGRARLGQGRTDEAIQILETALNQGVKPGSETWGLLGYAYARAGRREEAENLAAAAPSQNPFNQALIFAGLGDMNRTLQALDLAATAGPLRMGRALTWPEMSLLSGDPRVKALRKKVGLPE